MYIYKCNLNKINGLASFRFGVWKLRGKRRGAEGGRCPVCNKEETAVHILLKCNATLRWKEKLLDKKWLYISSINRTHENKQLS